MHSASQLEIWRRMGWWGWGLVVHQSQVTKIWPPRGPLVYKYCLHMSGFFSVDVFLGRVCGSLKTIKVLLVITADSKKILAISLARSFQKVPRDFWIILRNKTTFPHFVSVPRLISFYLCLHTWSWQVKCKFNLIVEIWRISFRFVCCWKNENWGHAVCSDWSC